MATPYTNDFNNKNSGKVTLEYSSEKITEWTTNGTPYKTWENIRNLILGLVHEGVPSTQGIYDLQSEENKLKLKTQELNDKRFATKVIRSGMRHNSPEILALIPEDVQKEIAKDIKSNS